MLAGAMVVAALPALTLAAGTTPADAATACRYTYGSGSLGMAIPDNDPNGVSTAIQSSYAETITDVDVMVDIDHTYDGDLSLILGFGAVSSSLSYRHGYDGDNYWFTTFDSSAPTSIADGSAPFTGSFAPDSSLNTFNGYQGHGTWYLNIADVFPGDTGKLNFWQISITYAHCDDDGDGADDPSDNCLGLANAGQRDTDGDGKGDACDGNDDGDHLGDHADKCDRLASPSPSGCPVVSRSLSAGYRDGAFRGRLFAGVRGCYAHQYVVVWKVRTGRDARIGAVATKNDGRWRLWHSRRHGKYYATVRQVVVPEVAQCSSTRSDRFRIR